MEQWQSIWGRVGGLCRLQRGRVSKESGLVRQVKDQLVQMVKTRLRHLDLSSEQRWATDISSWKISHSAAFLELSIRVPSIVSKLYKATV